VRARVEIHRNRLWLEIVLALAASGYVAWILLDRPSHLYDLAIDRFTLFPLSVGVGVWLPLLARSRSSILGELRREGGALVIEGGLFARRIPLRRVRGVRVAPGARGASLLLSLDDGGVVAAALDDVEDARRLADEIRHDAPVIGDVGVRASRLAYAASILRPAATAFALAYYLHVVQEMIPGAKWFYGLSALFSGIALLAIHLARGWAALSPPEAAARSSRLLHEYSAALRAHLKLHARARDDASSARSPRPRVVERGEQLRAWLARLRREATNQEAYRGSGAGVWARLEQAYRSAEVPLRERALALRILASGEQREVRSRIAEIESLAAEERAWLEAVALAESDEAALAQVSRRPPDFVA
jgi:hypothetical protein